MKKAKPKAESVENQNMSENSSKEALMSSVLYREYLELTQKNRKYRMLFSDFD